MGLFAETATVTLRGLFFASRPSAEHLGPQLSKPRLWALLCTCYAQRMPAPATMKSVTSLSEAFQNLGGAWPKGDAIRGLLGPSMEPLVATLAAAPEFGSLLVRAATLPQQPPSTLIVRALRLWLNRNSADSAAAAAAAAPRPLPHLDAQQVTALVQAMRGSSGGRGPSVAENTVLSQLFALLDHAGGQRAFPALALHTERALDSALGFAALDVVDPADDGTDHRHLHLFSSCLDLPRTLMHPTMSAKGCDGGWRRKGSDPQSAAEWADLQTWAVWLTKRQLVAKCEALVRANARLAPLAAPFSAQSAFQCALDVTVLLMDGLSQYAGPALQACLGCLSTMRKVAVRCAASHRATFPASGPAYVAHAVDAPSAAAAAAAPAAAADPAADSATSVSSIFTAANIAPAAATTIKGAATADGAAAAVAGGVSSAAVSPLPSFSSPTASDVTLTDIDEALRGPSTALTACLQLLLTQHSHLPLDVSLLAGSNAATAVLSLGAMQLLPLLVRLAARQLGSHAPSAADVVPWTHLLKLLVSMHQGGLQDLTAAAGVPLLLLRFLRALRRGGGSAAAGGVGGGGACAGRGAMAASDMSRMLLLVAAVMHTTVNDSACWMREVRRLSLVDVLLGCAAGRCEDSSAAALSASLPCEEGPAQHAESAQHAGSAQPQGDQPRDTLDENMGDLRDRVEAALEMLDTNATSAEVWVAPTWDVCLLFTLEQTWQGAEGLRGGRAGGCLSLWVGCCHACCPNLSGDSEAALKLRRCGGCQQARYCCTDCQRKAWRSGHRAACLDGQELQRQEHMQDMQAVAEVAPADVAPADVAAAEVAAAEVAAAEVAL